MGSKQDTAGVGLLGVPFEPIVANLSKLSSSSSSYASRAYRRPGRRWVVVELEDARRGRVQDGETL